MLGIQKKLANSFYIILSLPATAMGFALSVQIAALSWLLSTKFNLNIEEIGLVWAAGPIAGILGQVIIGIISDNVWFWNGRRRPFILIGGFLAALMLLALPNIGVISSALGAEGVLGVAIVVALTLDLAINISFNPTRSVIADVTPEGPERVKGYTWMQTISGSFGVLAYFIGANLGNITLIYLGAILVFVLSIFPSFFIEEPKELGVNAAVTSPTQQKSSFGAIMNIIRPLWGFLLYAIYGLTVKVLDIEKEHFYVEYFCLAITLILMAQALLQKEEGKTEEEAGLIGFQKVLSAHAFTWIGVQTMFVYMFSYLQDKFPDFSDDQLGTTIAYAFLILNAIAAVLPAFVLEPITRNIGRVRTHAICIAIMTIGYAGMWLAGTSVTSIYILMAILGIGWASIISLPFAIMSQQINSAQMGLYMGLFNLSVVLPQLVASLAIGEAVSKASDKGLTFLICTICLGASAILWFLVQEGKRQIEEA